MTTQKKTLRICFGWNSCTSLSSHLIGSTCLTNLHSLPACTSLKCRFDKVYATILSCAACQTCGGKFGVITSRTWFRLPTSNAMLFCVESKQKLLVLKMNTYPRLKEIISILELALWMSRMNASHYRRKTRLTNRALEDNTAWPVELMLSNNCCRWRIRLQHRIKLQSLFRCWEHR